MSTIIFDVWTIISYYGIYRSCKFSHTVLRDSLLSLLTAVEIGLYNWFKVWSQAAILYVFQSSACESQMDYNVVSKLAS